MSHEPVLIKEVLDFLNPQDSKLYIDATFGAGGYSRAILSKKNCNLFAIDRDPTAVDYALKLDADFGDRFHLLQGRFGDITSMLNKRGVKKVDGIVVDLGVSSMQLDLAERGFSFQQNGPLDMGMGCNETTAADLVNSAKEEELADIIFQYGDEHHSRRIARSIVEARKHKKIETTFELADLVRASIPGKRGKIDPATRTFQAIRIYVNDELLELQKLLISAEELLNIEGVFVGVSFHSLEDSIIKDFFAERAEKKIAQSKYHPKPAQEGCGFRLLNRRVVAPSEEEVRRNPRARSAKLRAAVRI